MSAELLNKQKQETAATERASGHGSDPHAAVDDAAPALRVGALGNTLRSQPTAPALPAMKTAKARTMTSGERMRRSARHRGGMHATPTRPTELPRHVKLDEDSRHSVPE